MPAGPEDADVVYLEVDDVLELYAAIIGGTARQAGDIDGNKRTALVAMLVFLEVNGVRVEATDPELANWILSLSRGATPEQLAERVRAAAVDA